MKRIAMKNALLLCCLAGSINVSWAQEYVGLSLGRSEFRSACDIPDFTCHTKSSSGRLFMGGNTAGPLNDWGINRYEFSWVKLGKVSLAGSAPLAQQLQDDIDAGIVRYANFEERGTASALVASLGISKPLWEGGEVVGRFGLAYVNNTMTTEINGSRDSSHTQNRLEPYLGLTLAQKVAPNTSVSLNVDWTRFKFKTSYTEGSGSVLLYGIGVQQAF